MPGASAGIEKGDLAPEEYILISQPRFVALQKAFLARSAALPKNHTFGMFSLTDIVADLAVAFGQARLVNDCTVDCSQLLKLPGTPTSTKNVKKVKVAVLD